VFRTVGFPAFLKPHSGGGWKHVYKVNNEPEFFDAENMRLAKEQDHRQRIALADAVAGLHRARGDDPGAGRAQGGVGEAAGSQLVLRLRRAERGFCGLDVALAHRALGEQVLLALAVGGGAAQLCVRAGGVGLDRAEPEVPEHLALGDALSFAHDDVLQHVVAGSDSVTVEAEGKKYDATVLARDANQDLAVVRVAASGLPTVTLGDSDGLELGQTAIAIGNALGEFSNTVSVGVVSGLSRTVTASDPTGSGEETIRGVIQTDAAINPGNSGGPLLNLRGEVVGINTAIASDAQNVGFAIPVNRAKNDITSVKSTGDIQTPYLGVRYLTVTADIATSQKLPVDHGALVRGSDAGPGVEQDSPAAKAGVQAEDIITAVNGQALDSDHALGDVIAQHGVGDVITLTIDRGGKEITLQATLTKRPTGQ